ncbi:hypothetical protein JXA27_05070 [Aerococcaceae bacterium zg-B36]|nr:hypothetical protein [Aerococcaceae bacterium zg-B36]
MKKLLLFASSLVLFNSAVVYAVSIDEIKEEIRQKHDELNALYKNYMH